ncbi:hypothetical protein ACA910_012304 [Epithemia clementina (nom. ined.)]
MATFAFGANFSSFPLKLFRSNVIVTLGCTRITTRVQVKLCSVYYQRYQGNHCSGYSHYGYFDGMGNASKDVQDLHIQSTTNDVTDMLHGYIRHRGHAPPLTKIPKVRDHPNGGGDNNTIKTLNNLDTVDL